MTEAITNNNSQENINNENLVYIFLHENEKREFLPLIQGLKTKKFIAETSYWEVDKNEIQNLPQLTQCQQLSYQEHSNFLKKLQEKSDEQAIAHTKEQIEEIQNRIYLDFVPQAERKWLEDKRTNAKFDSHNSKYYLDKADAIKPENINHVARCRRRAYIYANDFNDGPVTEGKALLANALNLNNAAQREIETAKALSVCAKEAAMGVPGAIKNFNEIVTANKMIGRKLSFLKSFSAAKSYYAEVIRFQNGNILDKTKITNAALHSAELKATQTLVQNACNNVKAWLPSRLAYACKNQNSDTAINLASQAFIDYVKAYSAETLFHWRGNNFIKPQFNDQAFTKIVVDTLKGIAPPLNKEQLEKVLAIAGATINQCQNIDIQYAKCINLMKEKIFSEDLKEFTKDIENSSEILKTDLIKKQFFSNVESSKQNIAIHPYNKSVDPLYLNVSNWKEQQTLAQEYPDKIFRDPSKTDVLCVEDTEENRKLFNNFLPTQEYVPTFEKSLEDMQAKAIEALREHGYSIDSSNIKMDEHWHKDPKDKSKDYIINLSGVPRLTMYDHNGSLNETVKLGELSLEEKNKIKEIIIKNEQNAEALKLQEQVKKAQILRDKFNSIDKNAILEHPYIKAKGLEPTDFKGCLYDKDGTISDSLFLDKNKDRKLAPNSMIVPLVNSQGQITAAQRISEKGEKVFLSGKIQGSFFPVGGYEKLKEAKTILIAEGIATAASIAKSVDKDVAVVACMTAINIESTTRELINKFPNAAFGICADNDIKSAGLEKINAGINYAERTCKYLENERSELTVIKPPLTKKQLTQEKLTDFNDAFKANPALVKETLSKAIANINFKRNQQTEAQKIDIDLKLKQQGEKSHARH